MEGLALNLYVSAERWLRVSLDIATWGYMAMSLSSGARRKVLIVLNAGMASVALAWAMLALRPDRDFEPAPVGEEAPSYIPISQQPPQTESVELHPLFNSSRAPIPESPTNTGDAAPAQTPPLLVGVMGDADGVWGCVLENLDSTSRKFVRVGNTFDGWTLVAVHPKKVVLRSGSEQIELQLSFESRSSPKQGNPDPTSRTP